MKNDYIVDDFVRIYEQISILSEIDNNVSKDALINSSALILLSESIKDIVKDFDSNVLGHEICMGIRHGIFGVNASSQASIDDSIKEAIGQINN